VDAGGTLTVGQIRGPGETFTGGPGTIVETEAIPPGVSQSTIQIEGGTFLANNPPDIGVADVLAGTLGGTGHVAEIVAEAGADVSPGVSDGIHDIATLFCDGPAILQAGAVFSANVLGNISPFGTINASDLLDVSGTAAIDGVFLDLHPSGPLPTGQFDILHADGGITGQLRFRDPGTGIVRTLSNGDEFPFGGHEFIIFYTHTDVIVGVVQTPGLPAFQNRSVTVAEGSVATVRGTIVDPAPQGPFVLRVDWGDSTPTQVITVPQGVASAALTAQSDALRIDPSGTLTLTHHYHEKGTFDIHLSWGDDRGTANTADMTATVPSKHPAQEALLDHQDHLGPLYWTIPDVNDPTAHQNPNTFVGKVPGTDAFIAVVIGGDRAIAYVCDGTHVSAWLHGEARDGQLFLTDDNGDRIVASLEGDEVTGLVDVQGLGSRTFTADRAADGKSGLFREEVSADGEEAVLSLIRIGDSDRGRMAGIPRGHDTFIHN
jgi:hypothetical protein